MNLSSLAVAALIAAAALAAIAFIRRRRLLTRCAGHCEGCALRCGKRP